MAVAFVLIVTTPGQEEKVFDRLKEKSDEFSLLDIEAVKGEYDIILKIGQGSPHKISNIVKKIENVKGIDSVDKHTGSNF